MVKLNGFSSGSSVVNESVPLYGPAAAASSLTWKVAEPFVATDEGKLPTAEKPAGRLRVETLSVAVPELAMVKVFVTGTLISAEPKLNVPPSAMLVPDSETAISGATTVASN